MEICKLSSRCNHKLWADHGKYFQLTKQKITNPGLKLLLLYSMTQIRKICLSMEGPQFLIVPRRWSVTKINQQIE